MLAATTSMEGSPTMRETLLVDLNYNFMGSLSYSNPGKNYNKNFNHYHLSNHNMVKHMIFGPEFLRQYAFSPERLRECVDLIFSSVLSLVLGQLDVGISVLLRPGRKLVICDTKGNNSSRAAIITVLWKLCLRWFLDLPLMDSAAKFIRFRNTTFPDKLKCHRNALVTVLRSSTTSKTAVVQNLESQSIYETQQSNLQPLSEHGVVLTDVRLHHGVCNHMRFQCDLRLTNQGLSF